VKTAQIPAPRPPVDYLAREIAMQLRAGALPDDVYEFARKVSQQQTSRRTQ